MTIADILSGYFRTFGANETTLVSTIDDPPKHRLGVLARALRGRGLGCLTFNVVRDDGSEDEHVVIQGKRTDQGGGELWVGAKRAGGGSQDADMRELVTLTDQGLTCAVPIHAPNLASAGPPDTMWAPNGLSFTQQQGDGNFVTYVTSVPWSKAGEHVRAVWSAWTGKL